MQLPPRSTAVERLNQYLVSHRPRTFAGRAIYSAALRLRRISAHNRSVQWTIGGRQLLAPASHSGPLFFGHYETYGRNLVDVFRRALAIRGEGPVIDVGANVGDGVALLRADQEMPILGVEGDLVFAEYFRYNTRGLNGVTLQCAILGEVDGAGGFEMVQDAGTGRVNSEAGPGGRAIQRLDTLLLREPAFQKPILLKIDTDGFDISILLGAEATLMRAHPVVFFEFYPKLMPDAVGSTARLIELFRRTGYRKITLWDNLGVRFAETEDLSLLQSMEEWLRRNDKYFDVAVWPRDTGIV